MFLRSSRCEFQVAVSKARSYIYSSLKLVTSKCGCCVDAAGPVRLNKILEVSILAVFVHDHRRTFWSVAVLTATKHHCLLLIQQLHDFICTRFYI